MLPSKLVGHIEGTNISLDAGMLFQIGNALPKVCTEEINQPKE